MAEVLVIGGGGREQALAWKLAQSPQVTKVYVAPGNAGSRGKIENVDIAFDDVPALLKFAQNRNIGLTVIGQEAASEAGAADAFQDAGLTIFGPTRAAVRIESSKAFSKDLMKDENIPTAEHSSFSDPKKALAYAKKRKFPLVISAVADTVSLDSKEAEIPEGLAVTKPAMAAEDLSLIHSYGGLKYAKGLLPPNVIKADGLATGKGVILSNDEKGVEIAIENIMNKKIFGAAGDEVVIEDFLQGKEVSMHALCDGTTSVMFPPSQDHKQIFDGDQGSNTGGMGAYAPVEWVTEENVQFVQEHAVEPALRGLKQRGAEFKGCLYPGLMIDGDDIKLLEFNARFGDPEAEVYMRLLDGNLFEIFTACAEGRLDPYMVKWRPGFAVTVVLASGGYPGKYPKGLPITGIDEAEKLDDIVVFHAGTAVKDGRLVTAGGRVLNVTATGSTLEAALDKAYAAVKLIHFDGMHYRTDIGRRPH